MANRVLDSPKIGRLLFKLSAPAMVGMFVMATYNVADTIFIGRGVGSLAIAAVILIAPFQILTFAIATMLGVGGASIYSRLLGAKKDKLAEIAFTNVVRFATFFGLFTTLFGVFFLDSILKWLGTSDLTYIYARDYFGIIIWGTLPLIFAVSLNNIARAEGRAKLAMGTMLVSSLINVILDPILIFKFNMGVKGAAYATVFAEIFTSIYLLVFFLRQKRFLVFTKIFSFAKMRAIAYTAKQILTVGMSSFVNQVSASIMVLVLNNRLMLYGNELSITVFAVYHRTAMFIFMPIYGIVQGMQPIAGYNYGAKKFDRVKHVIKLATIAGSSISLLGFVLLFFFPSLVIGIFTSDPRVLSLGTRGLRIMSIVFPLIPAQMVGSTTFQALGKPMPASF